MNDDDEWWMTNEEWGTMKVKWRMMNYEWLFFQVLGNPALLSESTNATKKGKCCIPFAHTIRLIHSQTPLREYFRLICVYPFESHTYTHAHTEASHINRESCIASRRKRTAPQTDRRSLWTETRCKYVNRDPFLARMFTFNFRANDEWWIRNDERCLIVVL